MKLRFSAISQHKAFKVFLWSGASAIVTLFIALLAEANIPEQYVVLVAVINTVLFSLKRFVEDSSLVE